MLSNLHVDKQNLSQAKEDCGFFHLFISYIVYYFVVHFNKLKNFMR